MMMLDETGWAAPPLSTACAPAAISYRDGIAALVSGRAHAAPILAAAIALDPGFVLARVGLAVARFVDGATYVAPPIRANAIGRAERQHCEVVDTALAGDQRHAADLRREHLMEFPGDMLIVWLPVLEQRIGIRQM